MEIGNQIKKYRTELQLSQEELADKIYVTRQTISNWENEKNYPDIKSLVMLSSLFNISLDNLVKGDLEEMKEHIKETDIKKFNWYSNIYTILLLASIILPVPLLRYLEVVGAVIWGIIAITSLVVALQVEKQKKAFDIQTYREIVAFMNGERLDEIDKQRELKKRKHQKMWLAVGAGAIALVVCAVMTFLLY